MIAARGFRPNVARCMECNGIIHSVDKQDIESRLLPLTKKYYDVFYQCDQCGKIYWEGSHFEKMRGVIKDIRSKPQNKI